MQWFRHYTNAGHSTSLSLLRDKIGLEGVAIYWYFVEYCASKWDGCSEPKFEISLSNLKQYLGINRTKLEKFLNISGTLLLFSSTKLEFTILVDFPKLLELQDKYKKYNSKRVVSRSQVTTLDTDTETETEIPPYNPSTKLSPSAHPQASPSGHCVTISRLDEPKTEPTQPPKTETTQNSVSKPKPKKPKSPTIQTQKIDELKKIWNEVANSALPRVKTWNPKRAAAAAAFLAQFPDPADWRLIIQNLGADPWCLGENDRGWVADFDYFLRLDIATKWFEKSSQRPQKRSPLADFV